MWNFDPSSGKLVKWAGKEPDAWGKKMEDNKRKTRQLELMTNTCTYKNPKKQ